MSKTFDKKNSQKYVVVHRPHSDPQYYDADASEMVLMPVENPNNKKNGTQTAATRPRTQKKVGNEHLGEAANYGIDFDDSNYDYSQHLRPIGLDPENAVFIPANQSNKESKPKKNIEDMILEPNYRKEVLDNAQPTTVFERGMAKPEYLFHQQEVADEISGFKPNMNPALREVLEALDDEAYVVNDDVILDGKLGKQEKTKTEASKDPEQNVEVAEDDDIFAELLRGGEADEDIEAGEEYDEWDIDNLEDYEDEVYQDEIAQLDNIKNLQDLQDIDIQADVRRFQNQQKQSKQMHNSDYDDLESLEPLQDEEDEEDVLGDLPTINKNSKSGNQKKKERRKKGAMSDVSGFSMTSSAIARTETMTVLDDKYDRIINGYENYEEEQEIDEDETYQPFNMKEERQDLESMLDDFLDNYELESGGRKLAKKDTERDKLKNAADAVSKGKLSMRRKRDKEKNANSLSNSLAGLKL